MIVTSIDEQTSETWLRWQTPGDKESTSRPLEWCRKWRPVSNLADLSITGLWSGQCGARALSFFSFVVCLTCFIELVCHCHTCRSEPCENLSDNVREALLVTEGVSAELQLLKAIFSHFFKVRYLWIWWGSVQSGAEWISIKEVILKPRISENG